MNPPTNLTNPTKAPTPAGGTPHGVPCVSRTDVLRPVPAPSVASAPGQGNPHFAQLGGEPVIRQLVDRFYAHMDALPQAAAVRAMHSADLGPVKRVLTHYLVEWTGGPQAYSVERGHPRLRRKHQAFAIGPQERDAWMACMQAALDEVVSDATLKAQLAQAFARTADFLRNDAAHAHQPSR